MTYIRVWIHLIWGTKRREKVITTNLKPKLIKHIRENAKKQKIYLDFLNMVEDHVHLLISLGATQTVSKVAQLLKGESSHWINDNNLTSRKFEWQDDYIALSVSESQVNRVRKYIKTRKSIIR